MTAPQQDPNGFLMGGGAKSAKFETIGTLIGGPITDEPVLAQQTKFGTGEPEFWNDGKPRMQLIVKVQTTLHEDADDDGIRAFYIKGEMQKAVRDAVRKAGATGLAIGGTLQIAYTGDGPRPQAGFPPKLYAAQYTAPVAGADFFAEPTPAAAPVEPNWGTAPASPPAPAATHAESRLVTLADGSHVTPEVAALLQQVQAGASA
jgi:hypothetical protein